MTPGRSPDLAAISARHTESQGPWPERGHACLSCWQPWPCDAAVLVVELERLRELLVTARRLVPVPRSAVGAASRIRQINANAAWRRDVDAALAGEPQP